MISLIKLLELKLFHHLHEEFQNNPLFVVELLCLLKTFPTYKKKSNSNVCECSYWLDHLFTMFIALQMCVRCINT